MADQIVLLNIMTDPSILIQQKVIHYRIIISYHLCPISLVTEDKCT